MKSDTWALKYRPQTFEEVTGQHRTMVVLRQMVHDGRLPHGMIFSGVRGSGKTTSARILGAALNCAKYPDGPCTLCPHCTAVAEGRSIDVLEIDAASNGSVDQIRSLRETVQYASGGEHRLILLDEAHSMSREAFNALLKTLEEPPDNTYFILLTTEPGRILETITSRCLVFDFRRIGTADIRARLKLIARNEEFGAEDELLTFIADRSDGSLRDAIMSLDRCHRVGITTASAFMESVGEIDSAPHIIKAMIAGDQVKMFELVDELLSRIGDANDISTQMIGVIRDAMRIKAGGSIYRQGKQLDIRREISSSVPTESLLNVIRLLWELKTKVRFGEDPRAMLDMTVILMFQLLSGVPKSTMATAVKPAKPTTVSFQDMRAGLRS